MKIKITETALNPWQEIENYQANKSELSGKFGATNIFIGTMRDFNDGDEVTSMTLEHYSGMTEKQLATIIEKTQQNYAILDVLLIHRVGLLLPNQPIVLIAIWAVHRGDAFDACREIMEALKSSTPFWKKENLTEGSRWVTKNSKGYQT
ncbi:MAG: molybdenum cofactor biosynthesis protein MoaE [Methylococcales bacterium]|nr:molybdenum cofactor biosynthesis protein MoaE [Methylococcales bacterium]MCK5924649.1 molybdenum cofactor biosynthesis protein MoaE [Methylococcales bacterium]